MAAANADGKTAVTQQDPPNSAKSKIHIEFYREMINSKTDLREIDEDTGEPKSWHGVNLVTRVCGIPHCLYDLESPDDIVIPRQSVTLVINYPVDRLSRTELKAKDAAGISRLILAQAICRRIAQMHAEESDDDSDTKSESNGYVLTGCTLDTKTGECTISLDS